MTTSSAPGDVLRTGFAGKMPSHDDFIEGGGALAARRWLLDWAGRGLIEGRKGGANSFTDRFLTMPIWRFVLGPGVIAPAAAAGALCPSVDRAGRAFPLIVVADVEAAPAEATAALSGWFDGLEETLLAALDPSVTARDLRARMADPPPLPPGDTGAARAPGAGIRPLPVDAGGTPDAALVPARPGGVWTTLGAVDGAARGLMHGGAPDAALLSALVSAPQTPPPSAQRVPR